MENTTILEIGEKVTWEVPNFKMMGVVLEDKGDEVLIQSHSRGNMPNFQEINVKKSKLTKI